jgi:seryl-tRNA synthetase
MIDIKWLRENPDEVTKICQQKNVMVDVREIERLDQDKRELQAKLDELSRQRNEIAAATKGTKPTKEQIIQGKRLKEEASEIEEKLKEVIVQFTELWNKVPNFASEDTPIGKDESSNVILRQVGEKPEFGFKPKPHWELAEKLDLIDMKTAGEVSGSRFAYLKNELALLQFALIQLGLSVLTSEETLKEIIKANDLDVSSKPFVPIIPPVFIRPEVLDKMARLDPREERYHIPSDDLYLTGSAEHTLGALHMDETLATNKLPIRYVGYSTAFRREAGSHGQDVRGILRLHQFDKLEMESFANSDLGLSEQNLMVAVQEYLMSQLKLPYQVVICSTGDMGGPDYRHIDIETWLPGQDTYRETHSADFMTDYQARRLRTRVKNTDGSTQYAYMNDATVLAIGRVLVAIMENYQQEDGSIKVPDVLQKWVSFDEIRRS